MPAAKRRRVGPSDTGRDEMIEEAIVGAHAESEKTVVVMIS
jgi:hypothetical protein